MFSSPLGIRLIVANINSSCKEEAFMQIDRSTESVTENQSYTEILREIAISTKALVSSEIQLITAEMKSAANKAENHIVQAVVFGALLAVSIIPFIAFLVIGLGDLLAGRYWLSSLIVAIICAMVGGYMSLRTFKKITQEDIQLPATRASLALEKDVAQNKFDELQQAARGAL
jgi:Flp pilus assembly protein TadB